MSYTNVIFRCFVFLASDSVIFVLHKDEITFLAHYQQSVIRTLALNNKWDTKTMQSSVNIELNTSTAYSQFANADAQDVFF